MRTVFFGTPAWAVPSLKALLDSPVEVAAVVTNPDKPAGRGMDLRPSPVKEEALSAGVEVLQPRRAREPELEERLRALAPDVAVVVAYGSILPGSLLEVPPLGFVNLHFSLLPAYRGAAPVQRAVIDGVSTSGVSIMVLTEGMDEGPVLATQEVAVEPADTAGTLAERMAALGAPLLVDTIRRYAAGKLEPRPQDHALATYAPKITTEEARIDWTKPADQIANLVRGLNPAPGAWTEWDGRRLKVWEVRPGEAELEPGALRAAERLLVGTGTGALDLADVQLAGKRRMTGAELARGLRPGPEARLT
ncbi:MAG TPA: methionyl-tRNA formyltransferase [Actinomycetota bacterium]|nr:methionyl-tRNA formyltransferase [Actinomycetota bacterium]